jgi:hypothetical protein
MMLNEKSDGMRGNTDKIRWNFETCCQKGLIEFVDVEEEESTMIAMSLKDF